MANPPRPLRSKHIESLNSKGVGTASKWISRGQTWLFKKTNGRLGGEPRDSPLLFLQEGRRVVLVASQGGRSTAQARNQPARADIPVPDTPLCWYRSVCSRERV
jgi:hypothetical protein